MPTTLAGLLVFIVTLLPGFVFITIYTWDRPRRRASALEQTAAIVLASVLTEAVTASLFALVRANPRIAAPGLDLLIREPDKHLGWVAGLLAVSSALAGLAAYLMRRRKIHPALMSSWWTLFHEWQRNDEYTSTYIQCELDDGSCVTGVLGDWDTIEEDSPDRDLILGSPITYRPRGDHEFHPHPVSVVCISAGRIVAMFVAYTDATSSPSAAAAVEKEAAVAGEPSLERSPAGDFAGDPARSPSGERTQVSARGHGRPSRSPSTSAGQRGDPSPVAGA